MEIFNIEIMPTAKSCEQGCPQCPLARHNDHSADAITKIDRKVQKTFTILEQFLKERDIMYDMHYSSRMDLFPKIQYPELLQMARFETSRSISNNGAQAEYSENIRKLLKKQKLLPTEICFSFVPKSPIINESEITVIQNTINEITTWYLSSNSKRKISCTIRSNFYPIKWMDQIIKDLKIYDKSNLNKAIGSIADNKKIRGKFKITIKSDFQGHLYYSLLEKKIQENNIEISNRVIVHEFDELKIEKKYDNMDFLMHQAMEVSCYSSGFLIDPAGVMMNHTSLAINNPILWLSHKDFHNILKSHAETQKTIREIIQEITVENLCMYEHIKRKYPKDKPTKSDYLFFFEKFRNEFKPKKIEKELVELG